MAVEFKEKLAQEALTIGIIGPVGVGKSTISGILSERFNIKHVEENFPDNPFLKKFYKDPRKWSFHSQYRFLLDKVEQIRTLDPTKSKIIDPELDMDLIYALTHQKLEYMNADQGALYFKTYSIMREEFKIKDPDITLRLYAPIEVLVERIKKRDRPFEKGIVKPPYKYLRALDDAINEYVAKDTSGRIIYLDVSGDDFTDNEHIADLEEQIRRKI